MGDRERERRRKEEQKAAAAQRPGESGRRTTSFVNGTGIDREVITTDIYRYLGNDALVKPGTYQDTEGYFITAYRPLTSEQLRDIKNDSAKWQEEKRRGRGPAGGYDSSDTRQKIWGEAEARQPQSSYQPPPQQGTYGSQVPLPNQPMGRGYDTFPASSGMNPSTSFRPPQPMTYNPAGQEAQYVTYASPPLATVPYPTERNPAQRMDEPRLNQPYTGSIQPQTLQTTPSYATPVGRGGPPYYSTGIPSGGQPNVQYQGSNQEYSFGRAPGPDRQSYDDYQEEEMEYETTPTTGPATTASTAPPRQPEPEQKRRHESSRRHHRQ